MAQTGYTPIQIYSSSTASQAPLAVNLTNNTLGSEIAINITDGKLYYKDNAGVVQTMAVSPTATGTANGVVYLNASKVPTSGSVLTFDGTTLSSTTVDTTNLEVTNVKAKDGTASASVADTTGYWTFSGTGAFTTPKGSTAQQPASPVTGMLRYNTTTNEFEGYSGGTPAWKSVGGATITNDTSTSSNLYPAFLNATSGTASTVYTSNAKLLYKPSTGELQSSALMAGNGFVVTSQTVATSYTIPSGSSAMSAGPITIGSGLTVTVPSGSRWVVV